MGFARNFLNKAIYSRALDVRREVVEMTNQSRIKLLEEQYDRIKNDMKCIQMRIESLMYKKE